jgi:hypothetical protein
MSDKSISTGKPVPSSRCSKPSNSRYRIIATLVCWTNWSPRPGDRIEIGKMTEPMRRPTPDDLRAFRQAHEDAFARSPNVFCRAGFEAAIEARLARIRDLTLPPDLRKLCSNGAMETKTLVVHLNEKLIFPERPRYNFVEVMAEPRYFAATATQHRWQNTLLSMRARLVRVPDSYNRIAIIFFCSAVSDIRER